MKNIIMNFSLHASCSHQKQIPRQPLLATFRGAPWGAGYFSVPTPASSITRWLAITALLLCLGPSNDYYGESTYRLVVDSCQKDMQLKQNLELLPCHTYIFTVIRHVSPHDHSDALEYFL